MEIEADEAVRRDLFNNAMEGKWDKVVKIYQDVPWSSKEKITTSGETALHIAISDCKEDVVEKLLETVIGISADVLRIQNAKGNTPLHLAASIGNVSMCRTIAGRYPEALRVRNEELETPLFLAARHGKIKVFFCLLEASTVARIERENYLPYRNKKSETVLHCAITGGHFSKHLHPLIIVFSKHVSILIALVFL